MFVIAAIGFASLAMTDCYMFFALLNLLTNIEMAVSPEELIIVAGGSTSVPSIEIIGNACGPKP